MPGYKPFLPFASLLPSPLLEMLMITPILQKTELRGEGQLPRVPGAGSWTWTLAISFSALLPLIGWFR